MNVKIPRKLSKNEIKELMPEIKQQCAQQTEQYEIGLDAVYLYTLSQKGYGKNRGYGKKKIEEIYADMFRFREEMKQRYSMGDDEDISEFAMIVKLKEKGIDVKELHDRYAKQYQFKVELT